MKTWYCVTTSFDNRGRGCGAITNRIESEDKPISTFASISRKDIYNDWFDDLDEAQKFAQQASKA